MEEEIKNQKPKTGRNPRKRVKLESPESRTELKKQKPHDYAFQPDSVDSHSSSGWSSEVIEPAIKSMNFRKRRGTNMKELLNGKHRKDHFWNKYQAYFGGDLDRPDNSEDQEEYQASSSGRDQFDSDFDLTDSYVGKRGRKKGTKVKRRKREAPKPQQDLPEEEPRTRPKRDRKKKVPFGSAPLQKSEILLKEEKKQITLKPEENSDKLSGLKAEKVKEKLNSDFKAAIMENQSQNLDKLVSQELSKNEKSKQSENIIQEKEEVENEIVEKKQNGLEEEH